MNTEIIKVRKLLAISIILFVLLSSIAITAQTVNPLQPKSNDSTTINILKQKLKKIEKKFIKINRNYNKKNKITSKKIKLSKKRYISTDNKKQKKHYLKIIIVNQKKLTKLRNIYTITKKSYSNKIKKIKKKINELSQPKNKPDVGVFTPSPYTDLQPLEQRLNNNFKYFLWYQSIAEDFDVALANWLKSKGTTLELAWEPHNPSKDPDNQQEYTLKSIIYGNHDEEITKWANQLKAFGDPVYFRPMSEMNGDWTAWGQTNGNMPGEYIRAWRHIHAIFENAGTDNVIWVWSPNRDGSTAAAVETYSQFYPGDRYVDFVGINGYNWGTLYNTPTWKSSWQNFDEVFGYSYKTFTNMTKKPIIICETATSEVGGRKDAWIKDAFTKINYKYPKIKILVWFNINKETEWRLEASKSSLDAFKQYAF